jgi:hypothetical protein
MPNRLAIVFLTLGGLAATAVGGFYAVNQAAPEAPGAPAALNPAPTVADSATPPASDPQANDPAPRNDKTPVAEKPTLTPPRERVSRPAERAAPTSNARTTPAVPREPASTRAASPSPVAPAASSSSAVTIQESALPPPAVVSSAPIVPASPSAADARPEPVPVADVIAPDPAPTHVELVVAADSVIGLRITDTISTETAQIEDNVEARIVRDVRVGGTVAIPAGARARGSVTVVERGGRFKDRARIGVRFHTLILADGTELPASTETVFRLGEAPGNQSATKVGGGAVLGALIGAIIGGGKGAAIGAASGAGAGTAAVMASDISEASFPAGTEVTARLLAPVSVITEP